MTSFFLALYKKYKAGTHREATNKCKDNGGNLAAPVNKKQNDELKLFMKKNGLNTAWLAIQKTRGSFFNTVDPNSRYRNWVHRHEGFDNFSLTLIG